MWKAVRAAVCALAFVTVAGGCTQPGEPEAGQHLPASSSPPQRVSPSPRTIVGAPASEPGRLTHLVVSATSGTRKVGSFTAAQGDLWLIGDCVTGTLKLHIDPMATLPIPCDDLQGLPFINQIVISTPATYDVWVEAPDSLTWNLRVEQ